MPEKLISTDGIPVWFEEQDREVAVRVVDACETTTRIVFERWRLTPPVNCQVFLMTSWKGFVFDSAPPFYKVLLWLSMPLWARRARAIWPFPSP